MNNDKQRTRLIELAKNAMLIRRGQLDALSRRILKLEKGDELCDHHWNGSDDCFEIYCTQCHKHLEEYRGPESEIYFATDEEAYCYYCSLTDEEKEKIEKDKVAAITKRELGILNTLNKKYKHLGENNVN